MKKRPEIQDFLTRKLERFDYLKNIRDSYFYDYFADYCFHQPDFVYDPYNCQLVCYYLGVIKTNFLFFLPMSAGKTKLALDLFNFRFHEDPEVKHGLILVPREMNIATWLDEIKLHAPTIKVSCIQGSTSEKIAALHREADLYLSTYSSLQFLMTDLVPDNKRKANKRKPIDRLVKDMQRHFQFFVADEIHKAGNRKALVYRLLMRLSKTTKYRYGMTATPSGAKVERLWAIFNLIDHGETLSDSLSYFKKVFFIKKYSYYSKINSLAEFDPSMLHKLYVMIKNRSITYLPNELRDLPDCIHRREFLSLSQQQRDLYRAARKGVVSYKGELKDLTATYIRSRMALSGYVSWKDDNFDNKGTALLSDCKGEWFTSFAEDITNEKIVIYYLYTETGKRILSLLKSLKLKSLWVHGGSKNNTSSYTKFREDQSQQILLINVASGDAGLQFEMATYCIFWETPTDPISRTQCTGRVARTGARATQKSYIIDLIVRSSIEPGIYDCLEKGINFESSLKTGIVWE